MVSRTRGGYGSIMEPMQFAQAMPTADGTQTTITHARGLLHLMAKRLTGRTLPGITFGESNRWGRVDPEGAGSVAGWWQLVPIWESTQTVNL